MFAYKGFNRELQATLGKGLFQFEKGKTYEEEECKCAKNGFHCAENPLDVLRYYSAMDTRFFIVEAAGDINQDGHDSRISCTRLTLIQEIDRIGLAVRGCMYMENHPERESCGSHVAKERGECNRKGDFIIVRGKHPAAAGVKGSWLFLVQEARNDRRITGIYPIQIDGKEYREGVWYGPRRGRICEKKRSES
ncbi:MAG: hypothetical protein K1W20_04975 [Lachnospiraceae bacterium]